jgi:hypothetical protein
MLFFLRNGLTKNLNQADIAFLSFFEGEFGYVQNILWCLGFLMGLPAKMDAEVI